MPMTDMFRNPAFEVDARSFSGLGAGAATLARRAAAAKGPKPRGTPARPLTSRAAAGVLAQQATANLLRPGAMSSAASAANVPPLAQVMNRAAEVQPVDFNERPVMAKNLLATLAGFSQGEPRRYGYRPRYAASLRGLDALGLPKWMRKVGVAIDPTRKGSLTYAAAAKVVGEQNLQVASAIGKGIKGQAKPTDPVITSNKVAEIEQSLMPQTSTQTWMLAGAGVLGAILVFSVIRRTRRAALAGVSVAGL
jgi:hypothetical protein